MELFITVYLKHQFIKFYIGSFSGTEPFENGLYSSAVNYIRGLAEEFARSQGVQVTTVFLSIK